MSKKVHSFTLAELIVVMIITGIIVGLAFSVLRIIQKQIEVIGKDNEKAVQVVFLEQMLWHDFNRMQNVESLGKNQLKMKSELDSVVYDFKESFVLRNQDTIKVAAAVEEVFFESDKVRIGPIDAVSVSCENEIKEYKIFVFKKNDLVFSRKEIVNGF
ncbi:type II secretion system GspH family protein [Flavobacterium amniphilum]|uniref:type II secretion system protein n=1 Tax=Flavobacterium amniphilum TaxID=1834035 RepID=UPI00202AA8FF|nr:type II secretion system protein [Flavobacterium amniphilum]MCL9806431.1 type II secretion system GspH family protein [Flavobacterium amniphilum]